MTVCHSKGTDQLLPSSVEVVVVHVVAASVVGDLDVPGFGQHLDLLCVNTIDKVEVCVAKLEIVQRELDADALQRKVEGGEFPVVWRRLRSLDKLAE